MKLFILWYMESNEDPANDNHFEFFRTYLPKTRQKKGYTIVLQCVTDDKGEFESREKFSFVLQVSKRL